MIASRAGAYRATGLALASLGALATGILLWAIGPWMTAGETLAAELGAFAFVFGLLELTPLGDRITPSGLKTLAAQRLARAAFLDEGLASTPERNAILLFVSLAEHHVEILADSGIHGRVADGEWKRIVDTFTGDVRAGDVESGFVNAVKELGSLLAQHYPRDDVHPNTLPNRLILLS